eukprot:1156962-Pelagomonas_calceolata.AAC.5
MSNAPNALHSISDKLDWDEFLSRQYAFLSQQILRNLEESGAPASPPKPILSSGSAKIMQRKEMEGEHYIPPYQRPLSPGRSDLSANTRSTAGKAASSFSQASLARDRIMGSHKVLGEEPSHKPLVSVSVVGCACTHASVLRAQKSMHRQQAYVLTTRHGCWARACAFPELILRLRRTCTGRDVALLRLEGLIVM